MSVLACDRRSCQNVMCDDMLFGNEMYICRECLQELEAYKETWELPITENEIEDKIRLFMDSKPGSCRPQPAVNDRESMEEIFDRLVNHRPFRKEQET